MTPSEFKQACERLASSGQLSLRSEDDTYSRDGTDGLGRVTPCGPGGRDAR